MKKILTALLVTVITSVSAFANSNNSPLNEKVLKAFNSQFSTAVNVTWKEMKGVGLYHASFNSGQQTMDAFFNEEGELVTTARTIDQNQLPLSVGEKINAAYSGSVVDKDVIELNSDGYTSYYVTVRNSKATLILKADAAGSLSVFKKVKNSI